jgi:hypothetical protein
VLCSAPLLPPVQSSSPGHRSATVAAPPPPSTRRLPQSRLSFPSLLPFPARATAFRAARRPPRGRRRVLCPCLSPLLSFSAQHNQEIIEASFASLSLHRAHPELQTPPPPLFLSGEPRATVGSSHRPPIAPANPSTSFLDLYSCSLAPSHRPISTGAPSPTTTVRRRLLLTVGSSLRAFPRHHNPSASTTSTP